MKDKIGRKTARGSGIDNQTRGGDLRYAAQRQKGGGEPEQGAQRQPEKKIPQQRCRALPDRKDQIVDRIAVDQKPAQAEEHKAAE